MLATDASPPILDAPGQVGLFDIAENIRYDSYTLYLQTDCTAWPTHRLVLLTSFELVSTPLYLLL